MNKPAKPSDEKREHVVWDDKGLISVAGGKLTTYRLIALDVLQKAAVYIDRKAEDFSSTSHFDDSCDDSVKSLDLSYVAWSRLRGRYGQGIKHIAAIIREMSLPPSIILSEKVETSDTIWAELVYACRYETVQHLDDLLLRRTRLGLLLPRGAQGVLDAVQKVCAQELDWSDAQWQTERQRYESIIAKHYQLPVAREFSEKPEEALAS